MSDVREQADDWIAKLVFDTRAQAIRDLEPWLKHHTNCIAPLSINPDRDCTCGLARAKEKA